MNRKIILVVLFFSIAFSSLPKAQCTVPSTPSNISGLVNVCPNQTNVNYSIAPVTGATSYNWTAPAGASIVSGQGTPSITVDFGITGGNICVTASNTCGTSAPRCKTITVKTIPTAPDPIGGVFLFCAHPANQFQAYTIGPVAGATSYNWAVSPGASVNWGQGLTTVSINVGTAPGYETICVTASNGCGTSLPTCATLTLTPFPSISGIIGTTTVCANQTNITYSVSPLIATTYTWTIPAGATITSGQGTNSITVDVGNASGDVCVIAKNSCGNSGLICLPVTIGSSPAIGSITGNTLVCAGQVGTTYTIPVVPGATAYNWTVPAGAVINTGQGTNTITVDHGSTAGNICVSATTICGNTGISCIPITIGSVMTVTVASQNDASCKGDSNGSVTVNTTGGNGAYSYTWSNGATAATNSNLPAALYNVTVTDGNMCSANTSVTIQEPAVLTASILASGDVLCFGGNDGFATVAGNGGNAGTYYYSWSNAFTTATASNLSAGFHSVTITDSKGCMAFATVTIAQPPVLTVTVAAMDAACNLATGVATAGVSGGKGTINYLWSNGITSAGITNIGAGIYFVTVTDDNGCTDIETATINNTSGPVINSITTVSVSCFGEASGSAAANVTGSNLTYTWSNNTTTATINGLTGGLYSVTVTDANNCSAIGSVTIDQPLSVLSASVTVTEASCGQGDGSASLTVSGGTVGYNFNWLPSGGNGPLASNLSAGTYSVTLTDGNGCTLEKTAIINNTSGPVISGLITTSVSCFSGTNGSISVSVAGNGTLQYAWSNGGSENNISNLHAGIYSLTVTDGNNCKTTLQSFVSEPSLLILSVDSLFNICAGQTVAISAGASGGTAPYSFSWNGGAFTGEIFSVAPASASIYSVIVADANGCIAGPSSVTVSVNPVLFVTTSKDMDICEGGSVQLSCGVSGGTGNYFYDWNPGGITSPSFVASPAVTTTYTLSVSDNCSTMFSFVTVTVHPLPVVQFSSDSTSGCVPLCINFNILSNPASYNWNFGDGTFSSSTNKHCYSSSGVYSVSLTISDIFGCINTAEQQNMITIYSNPVALFTATPQETSINNPVIQFTDQSTGANFLNWYFGDKYSSSSLAHPQFIYEDTGKYMVTLIAINEFGCKDSIALPVIIKQDYNFYIPNTFTPNGDGLNDVFLPVHSGAINKDYELTVYDRWGKLIFKTNDIYEGWNANANGTTVQQGCYNWKIFIRDYNNSGHHYMGSVNVIR